MDGIFDLFGQPVTLRERKAGRPEHEATPEKRNRVMILLALGWTNERIASALAISQPTLRKYYVSELRQRDIARDRLDATRFAMCWEQAKAGNVAALKEFGRMLERSDLMLTQRAYGEMPEPAPRPLGKKEAAALEAETAGEGSEWGDDLRFPGSTVN
ncbi:hypothetical protein DFO45_2668 [Azorhizobium sp. AG788]|uniref:AraC family transcriptional regulator n=1 Tax=Azorhizobium sp. AG788 TaxID=2183897 RepID=UPI00105C9EA7|nr:AraC family transcriptional regulator [Azorhizobium sp. AG788]TDT94910.1 hypothetical protein DFO45_2668 [Azorhizobium sp. AG788]